MIEALLVVIAGVAWLLPVAVQAQGERASSYSLWPDMDATLGFVVLSLALAGVFGGMLVAVWGRELTPARVGVMGVGALVIHYGLFLAFSSAFLTWTTRRLGIS